MSAEEWAGWGTCSRHGHVPAAREGHQAWFCPYCGEDLAGVWRRRTVVSGADPEPTGFAAYLERWRRRRVIRPVPAPERLSLAERVWRLDQSLRESNHRTADLMAEVESLREAHEQVRAAAVALLALKDGNRGVAYYEQRDAAWQALRDSLAGGLDRQEGSE